MTTLDPKRVKSLLEYATPAPWVVEQDADETYTVQSIGAIRAAFCNGHYAGLTAPNDLEDIHLAALAPQLAQDWLRMREELVGWLDTLKQATHEAPDEYLRLVCKEVAHTLTRILGDTQ